MYFPIFEHAYYSTHIVMASRLYSGGNYDNVWVRGLLHAINPEWEIMDNTIVAKAELRSLCIIYYL